MKRQSYYICDKVRVALLVLMALLTACNDDLYEGSSRQDDATDGIQFSVTTVEQADMTINVGGTRTAADTMAMAARRQADRFVAHPLEGDNPDGLTIHHMPLPYVGIHPHTVASTAATTRAPLTEIVKSDGTNFHDSLTIWGCVFDPDNPDNNTNHYFLFSQTLLKRIRNWRSSVQWPYEDGKYMRFCAVSPAFESLNMTLASEPQYDNGTLVPPTFKYTLPETAGEMRDVLFGMSDPVIIDVQSIGTKEQNLGRDNKTVNLTFQHAMTAIRFAQGTIPTGITVKKISLKGVYTQGTYDPATVDAATGSQGTWTLPTTPPQANYELTGLSDYTEGSNTYIDGQQVMFMIPHTVTEDAELEVVIEAKPKYTYSETGRTEYTGDVTQEHTLKCSLKGDVWKKGYTVTYKLTIGEVEDGYYLLAESPGAFEHSDSPLTGTFHVHSYHSYWDYSVDSEDNTHAVNWKVAGYSLKDPSTFTETDDYETTNPTTWLTISGTNSGTSGEYVGGDGSVANYIISPQSYTKSGNHAQILGRNSTSPASSLNLSVKSPNGVDMSSQTANCYIVNRQGTYKFPLVYGNKTSDGDEAASFVDHKGTVISKKLIKDQIEAKNPSAETYETIVENSTRKRTSYTWTSASGSRQTLRAVIVWQDVSDLITSPTISATEIGFTVSKSTPGNAVIALQGRTETVYQKYENENWILDTSQGTDGYEYGDWETFWTWHIWMTDEVYKNTGKVDEVYDDSQFLNATTNESQSHLVTITNNNSESNTILPVNLGWVPDEMDFGFYSKREVWVKLEQTESKPGGTPATTVVHIVQHARQPLITGTSTIYQWGRPTALPMVLKGTGASRTIYDGSGNDITSDFSLKYWNNAGDHITQTTKLLRYDGSGNGGNAWFDAVESSSTVPQYWSTTKTVYDPCPPGFFVPSHSIFTGFSHDGGTQTSGSGLNMYPEVGGQKSGSSSAGGYLYTTKYTDANAPARYSDMVYIPVTREWQGDLDNGTLMSDVKTNNSFGFYWCSDAASGNRAPLLWICPQWSYSGTNDKPAIQFGRFLKYSSAQPIRPTGNLPAY